MITTGEVEELVAEPIGQGQFAPLSDSLCWAILELTSIGENKSHLSLSLSAKSTFIFVSISSDLFKRPSLTCTLH